MVHFGGCGLCGQHECYSVAVREVVTALGYADLCVDDLAFDHGWVVDEVTGGLVDHASGFEHHSEVFTDVLEGTSTFLVVAFGRGDADALVEREASTKWLSVRSGGVVLGLELKGDQLTTLVVLDLVLGAFGNAETVDPVGHQQWKCWRFPTTSCTGQGIGFGRCVLDVFSHTVLFCCLFLSVSLGGRY